MKNIIRSDISGKAVVFHALLFICVCLHLSSGAQNFLYAKGMSNSVPLGGDVICNSIKLDNAGNIFVTGYFEGTADFDPGPGIANLTSQGGSKDIFIARYSSAGNYVFAKSMGGPSSENGQGDIGSSIALDEQGNIYMTGFFIGTADFDPGPGITNLTSQGGEDIFVAKYDASGNLVFAKSMGGINDDRSNGISVDAIGNVYITGEYYGTVDFDPGAGVANLFNGGIFFAKYNASGNYVYAKGFEGAGVSSSIDLDAIGNIIVTGSFNETMDFDPGSNTVNLTSLGSNSMFLAKYDGVGNYLFAKTIAGEDSEAFGKSIALDGMGNIFVTGPFVGIVDFDPGDPVVNLDSEGSWNVFFARYDAFGNYVFAKAVGAYFGNGIALDGSGNILITGAFHGTVDFDPDMGKAELISAGFGSNIFVAKYDPTGSYIYAKAMEGVYGDDNSKAITVDSNGNIYTAGSFSGPVDFDPGTNTFTLSIDGTNAFISCLSSIGDFVWATQLGHYASTRLFDEGTSIVVDKSGNVYVAGYFQGTVDFDPGPGIANLVSAGEEDIFIAKYDPAGNYLFAKSIGGIGEDKAYSIALDASGNLLIAGSFKETADFDPGSGVVNLTAGYRDIFLAKYDASGNYVYAKSMGGPGEDIALGMAVDSTGNVYLTGYFGGTADFDPGVATASLTSKGYTDIFIAKYDVAGNYVYAKGMGGTNYAFGEGIAVDAAGNVFITGTFYGSVDFDPGAGTVNYTTAGEGDIFFAKYDVKATMFM